MSNSKEMAVISYDALEEKKGQDIKVLDISKISVLADYFIIASASNSSQMQALIDNVEEKLAQAGYHMKRLEGNKSSSWVLMDYGDLVIHIFDQEDRLFYDLERIWSDGQTMDIEELRGK